MSMVVFLKNGEKAPLPDANYVKLEPSAEGGGQLLRCLFGEREVGLFKWDEIAGYSIDIIGQPASTRVNPRQPTKPTRRGASGRRAKETRNRLPASFHARQV